MNLYVGNLSYQATDEDIRLAFEAHGEVNSVKVIKDKYTGEPRGFGFVEMPNDEQANAAIKALSGQDLKGRAIVVNEARPQEDRRGGGGGGGGGGRGGRGGRDSRGGGGGGRRSW